MVVQAPAGSLSGHAPPGVTVTLQVASRFFFSRFLPFHQADVKGLYNRVRSECNRNAHVEQLVSCVTHIHIPFSFFFVHGFSILKLERAIFSGCVRQPTSRE